MTEIDLLDVTAGDGSALVAAAQSDWARPIPHCPDWDAAALVGHLGGIFSRIAQIVVTGEQVLPQNREAPPNDVSELASWYLAHLDRTLGLLMSTDPEAPVWTFSSRGVSAVGWWRRRVAVETAIHRWDAQFALTLDGAKTAVLDRGVATAGIAEFVDEFLPGLAAQPMVNGLGGLLLLESRDGDRRWRVDLDALRGARDEPTTASGQTTTIAATSSDLLLWLTNREPVAVEFEEHPSPVVRAWSQLRR
jgi:uncharacterized protein (TIGR03083 family)